MKLPAKKTKFMSRHQNAIECVAWFMGSKPAKVAKALGGRKRK